MKNLLAVSIALLIIACGYSQSQQLVSTVTQKRNVVLEEFTGIHCGFCPEGHAIAKTIYDKYPDRVVLINIHQGSYAIPGAGEPDFRTQWGDSISFQADVSGYPSGTVNRHFFTGKSQRAGTAMNRNNWLAAAEMILPQNSPVNVGAESQFDPATRKLTINVELYYTGVSNTTYNYINVAFLQSGVVGPQTGGSDNYIHNHILREFITGQWGEQIETPFNGTLIKKQYTYTVPQSYIIDSCDVAVYVAESHQEILSGIKLPANGGTTLNVGTINSEGSNVGITSPSEKKAFDIKLTSNLTDEEEFKVLLSTDAPSDWQVSFNLGGTDYSNTADITLKNNEPADLILNITPGNTPAIANYFLKFYSVKYPKAPLRMQEVTLMSGIKDLIVNNDAEWGDGGTTKAKDFDSNYVSGLSKAGSVAHAPSDLSNFLKIANAGLSGQIKNIYYNVGWSFPSLTTDLAHDLADFLDNGGNLFISGQDFAWDQYDTARGHGTDDTRAFFENYLNAGFVRDGDSTSTQLTANPDEVLFRYVSSSKLNNAYGTGSTGQYFYPEEVSVHGVAVPTFYYNNNKNKIGCFRVEYDNYKVVFMGATLEMIEDISVRNQIMKITYDWFYGKISSVDFDMQMAGAIGGTYPNPANSYAVIPLPKINNNLTLKIYNELGNVSGTYYITDSTGEFRINTDNLAAGVYMYNLSDGTKLFNSGRFVVSH
ncbi:MAG: Omp28-related outer membrane protein [Bacteroidota bacterium]|nr:Omp28-related outer membrane protein [Bacteroidota bacterium]